MHGDGDGNGLWSALHIEDVARVFVAGVCNPVAFGQTYNATAQEGMTWRQYHEKVAKAMDVEPPRQISIPTDLLFALAPERAEQGRRSLPYPGLYDATTACRDLGFRQQIPFQEGIRRTIQWLERQGKIKTWESDPGYDRILAQWDSLQSSLGIR